MTKALTVQRDIETTKYLRDISIEVIRNPTLSLLSGVLITDLLYNAGFFDPRVPPGMSTIDWRQADEVAKMRVGQLHGIMAALAVAYTAAVAVSGIKLPEIKVG